VSQFPGPFPAAKDTARSGSPMSGPSDGPFAVASSRSKQLRVEIASEPGRFRVLTGDRPTGPLHLGHYFGTIVERVRLQSEGVEGFLVIADYQVITDRDTTANVRANVHSAVLDYLASGLDPAKTTIFTHSSVPALNQLLVPLLSLVTEAELHRNPTVKAELAASGRSLSGLLLTYPVHQAADILFCKANLVPVGRDNLPHVEIARTVARRFNDRYGSTFPLPDALITSAPEVPGLDGRKMSKSYGNAIALSMTDDETVRAIRRSPTDSDRHIGFDPEHRPGVSALLSTAALCLDVQPEDLAESIGDGGAAELKRVTSDAVNSFFAPLRERRRELATDPMLPSRLLAAGSARANRVADDTLAEVRQAMGTDY
jgi:tryptophanyl-tRNA synthetase